MPDGHDNKPRYKSGPGGGGRGPFKPRTDDRAGFKPRTDDRAGFKPRTDDRAGFKPRTDDRAGFKPRTDDRAGFKPRTDDRAGFKPRTDDRAGFKPRTDDRAGFKPRDDNHEHHHGSNPHGNAFSRYSDRNSVRVIDRSEQHRGKPFGDSFDRPLRATGDRPVPARSFEPRPARPVEQRAPRPVQPLEQRSPRPMRPVEQRTLRPVRPVEQRTLRPVRPVEQRPPRRADEFAPAEAESTPNVENILSGRNPIREALRAGRDLEKLMVAKGDLSGSAREIVAAAREKGVPVHEVDRAALERLSPAHQGLVAIASAYKYSSVDDILARAAERGEAPLVVILDGITDPHNLGAIIRSAECAGAHGVIIPDRRAVGLTAAAVKASAGAVEHLPVARVVNITRLLAELKEKGLWILAAHTSGEDYTTADLSGSVALVVGSEGEGVSRLVLEKSDKRVTLPIRGRTDSLNASVAAGILLYEVARRRGV